MSLPYAGPRRVDRRKRAILRAVVAENLATIEGLGPQRTHRRTGSSWLWWTPVTALALLVLAGTLRPTAAGPERPRPGAAARSVRVGQAEAEVPSSDRTPWQGGTRAIEPATFKLAVRRVVIDPGHGGNDPGATTNGLREKDLTLDIASRLSGALKEGGFEVVMTRDADVSMSLQQRVQAANKAHGDVFLSIHVNSIPAAARRGVETYVLGAASDPRVVQLSGAENSGSGYSLADFRQLLEGVLIDVRHQESHRFGQAVQSNMFAELRRSNPRLEDRGVKQAPFVVLVGTEMPAVLAEVSCLSNPEDTELLRDASYRQTIAEALTTGVRDFAASCNRPTEAVGGQPGGM